MPLRLFNIRQGEERRCVLMFAYIFLVIGALMIVNLGWPRAEIFNPTGEFPLLQWAGPITVAAVVALGALCYPRGKTHPNPVTIGA